jgi:hypothetical protein
VLHPECEYPRRAALSAHGDQLPDCRKHDPIGPAQAGWDVPPEIVDQASQRQGDRDELFGMKASG